MDIFIVILLYYKISYVKSIFDRCTKNDLDLNNNNTRSFLESMITRNKRSLTFPKGSSIVVTLQLLKAIQIVEPRNWNIDFEFDITWPIPENSKSLIKTPIKLHRRHRRELYTHFEFALNSQNLPGKQCILRSICEAKLVLSPIGISVVEDIIRVILSYPNHIKSEMDDYDIAYQSYENCDKLYFCPFSLLNILLAYVTQMH